MLLVLFLMSLAGEPPAPAQPPFSPAAARGADAARTRCESCHAVGRDDASPNPAAPPLREIRGRYPVEALEEAFAEGVVVGHDTPMPSFVLTPEDIADLTAYLRELGTPDGSGGGRR